MQATKDEGCGCNEEEAPSESFSQKLVKAGQYSVGFLKKLFDSGNTDFGDQLGHQRFEPGF